jgi:hypothetical protein
VLRLLRVSNLEVDDGYDTRQHAVLRLPEPLSSHATIAHAKACSPGGTSTARAGVMPVPSATGRSKAIKPTLSVGPKASTLAVCVGRPATTVSKAATRTGMARHPSRRVRATAHASTRSCTRNVPRLNHGRGAGLDRTLQVHWRELLHGVAGRCLQLACETARGAIVNTCATY